MSLRALLSALGSSEEKDMLVSRLGAVLSKYEAHGNHHLRSDVLSLLDHTLRLAEGFSSEKLSADEASTSIAMIGAIHSRMLIYLAGAKNRISGYSVRLSTGDIYPGFFMSESEAQSIVNTLSRIGVSAAIVGTQLTSSVVTSPLHQPTPIPSVQGVAEAQIPHLDVSSTSKVTSEPGMVESQSGVSPPSPPPSFPLPEKKT